MYSKTSITKFTENYLAEIKQARVLIEQADALVIGIGSGLSVAGGLDYSSSELAQKWYPEYSAIGLRSIAEIMSLYWPDTVSCHPERFWGFWAKHIYHIRYEPEAALPYRLLFDLTRDKNYFIISTNVDGQLEKAGFKKEKIFAPQGDYSLLQCQIPCCEKLYDNREIIETMLCNMTNAFEVRKEDVPKCSCGAYLIPNLRCDNTFVETPHMRNKADYMQFIRSLYQKKAIFLELGVGFNTPDIIRFPFEQMTKSLSNSMLIRINNFDIRTIEKIEDKALFFREDLFKILYDILDSI